MSYITRYNRENIAQACRTVDAQADEGFILPDILARYGVPADDALYVADQRVSRGYAVTVGELDAFLAGKPITVPRNLAVILMSTWIDGFVIGQELVAPGKAGV